MALVDYDESKRSTSIDKQNRATVKPINKEIE
jgi:hypothetical protein